MDLFSYVLTFIEGILTFISPCILPMLPIYFLYLAGASNTGVSNEDDMETSQKRKKLIINSFGFVIGFTVVFVMLGATITVFGRFLVNQKDLLRQISGVVMVLFGLNFIGVITLKFLNVEKRINYKINKLGFLKSIVFGIVFGFGWTPCIGAFLGSALALASNSKTIVQGVILLLVYSIGLGIPFIISSIIFDKLEGTLKQIQKHSRLISIISGVLLVIAGILVFTDSLKYLNY
jgi:cytochrome c-type biogenesis protein